MLCYVMLCYGNGRDKIITVVFSLAGRADHSIYPVKTCARACVCRLVRSHNCEHHLRNRYREFHQIYNLRAV